MKIAHLKDILFLFKDSFLAWEHDKAWRLGAGLAYFTVFSLAPLLLIVIVIAGSIFGPEAAQGQIVSEIGGLIGLEGARMVEAMLENAYHSGSSWAAALFGILMLFFGATAVFVQLRQAINTIWQVEEIAIGNIKGFLKARLISFALIIVVGFLLLVSLTVSTAIAAFGDYLSNLFLGFGKTIKVLDLLVSFLIITLLFALIFKILPNAKIRWKDVWIGSAVTSLLFTFGKVAIGLYLGHSGIGSTFGAAASLVIIMLWAFYSVQILLFGVEFTKLYADRFGSNIFPDEHSVRIEIKKVPLGQPGNDEEPC